MLRNDPDKLLDKIERDCGKYNMAAVFFALSIMMCALVDQLPEELHERYTLKHIDLLLHLPSFNKLERDLQPADFDTIAEIDDDDSRTNLVLGKIKALAEIGGWSLRDACERVSLMFPRGLERHSKRRQLGAGATDLQDVLVWTAAIIGQIRERHSRLQVTLMAVQELLSTSVYDEVDTSELKAMLRAIADTPDEQFRAAGRYKRLDAIGSALRAAGGFGDD